MRTKKRLLTLFLVGLLCVGGCSSSAKTTQTQSPAATNTPDPAPTMQVFRSKTSGKLLSASAAYKPVGIMIENSPAARPQTGLQSADVVYEAPVEGSVTRFFCIFNDNLPKVAGPVRSARVYFMRIQQEWDSAYAHFGGATYGAADVNAEDISKHIKTRINFLTGFNNYYWRTKDRIAPHNAYTDIQKLQTLMKQEAAGRTFLFDDNAAYTGDSFSEVTLPFNGSSTTYKYDAKTNVLTRYMSGKEFKDAATNKAITVQNVIVQYARFYHNDMPGGLWLCDLLGTGKAEFFLGGKHIVGTWERKSYDSTTVYKDANGKEIVLIPGNTWIAVHPNNVNITVN